MKTYKVTMKKYETIKMNTEDALELAKCVEGGCYRLLFTCPSYEGATVDVTAIYNESDVFMYQAVKNEFEASPEDDGVKDIMQISVTRSNVTTAVRSFLKSGYTVVVDWESFPDCDLYALWVYDKCVNAYWEDFQRIDDDVEDEELPY